MQKDAVEYRNLSLSAFRPSFNGEKIEEQMKGKHARSAQLFSKMKPSSYLEFVYQASQLRHSLVV